MSKQLHKHTIGLAGEFLVAGELLRRGIMAAVTYGNAKKADVIGINGTTAVSLEVKSTAQSKWVLGSELPADNSSIWILVHLPENEFESPEYFVITSAELRKLLLPQHEAYNAKYREKHGKDFSSKGVVTIQRKLLIDGYLGAWEKVRAALKLM
ncbi:hypothetical protein QLH52_12940 [Methylomonas sp. OY6]|uniref:Holliday junction resolvase n=1 Tax=Methylomonas defluvii TaxID=3045149 RepID=A0ABU4UFD6_9GAMM|nr:hypothetical protein [Methylomonas sp. OY6]MDX8128195.1 hypothetical protein [Methylomonas sp. OY6]